MMSNLISVQSILTLAIFFATILVQVSASWGPWGEYSSCSRTCGGGVRSRTRRCTSPRSNSCTGESVSYESCQTKACSDGAVDFRTQQCNSLKQDDNVWISYYDMSSPCTLFCENQLGQVAKKRDTVLDGTTCDSHHSFGLCVAGVCKQVGCDHVIGSTKTVDDCLVCGGRGENCDSLSGTSEDTTLKVGETSNLVTFPFGTTKLEIRATTREPAIIELRATDGEVFNLTEYLTDGSHNRSVDFYGAVGMVKPIDNGFRLTARGPLSRTLHLKVQPSGASPTIKYDYSIPISRFIEKDPQLRFTWVDGTWTSCSDICGPGQQRRAVNCIDRSSGQIVSRDLCPAKDMPALSRACQNRPCHQTLEEKYKWIPGTFSDCNTECGAGHQTQRMFCLQTEHNSESAYVPDAECEQHIGKKPVVRRACFGTETQCGNWITGVWSQCSVTCGQGRQTRSVACEKIYQNDDDEDDGEDESSPSDDQSLCPADSRPATEQSCNLVTCSDLTDDEISIVTLIHDCQTSRYGCCPDQVTAAVGENQLGCDTSVNSGCRESAYGCCYDGVTPAKGPNKVGCPRLIGGCRGTRYGCCKDGVTSARGSNKEGCEEDNRPLKTSNACADSSYGCCADGRTAAIGPNALGCPESKNVLIGGCRSTRYGCCSDGVTAAGEDGCSVFDQAHCELEKDSGSCSNYTLQYHFDMTYGVCRKFWYAGCGGNQNRFLTEDDCNNNCVRVDGPGVCRLPKVAGVCKTYSNRFFYNHKTQQCEMFSYGGCKGNNNNFATIEECQAKCQSTQLIKPTARPIVRQLACDSFPCQNGFTCQEYHNGSYSCSCNPNWGKNCEAPPNYWCFSDSECSQSLKCVRHRKCQHGYCWIDARCSPASKIFKCDKEICPTRQVCVNDDSFQDRHFCVNTTSYKRPTKVVHGCSLSEFGCCSDKLTPAKGPNHQGCRKNCLTSKYGCCKDGVTSADGPNYLGCEIEGSGEVPCDKTVYGCCEDGFTSAEGPRGQGCGDTVDSEDRERETTTKRPTKMEKCTAMNGGIRCKEPSVKWRYNTERKDCDRHWWGGCEDNGNVFDSKEQCEASCKPKTVIVTETFDPDIVSMCELPSERGPCKGKIQRYYYNPKEQRCILFMYGGCQGNENNFLTLESCQKECMGTSVTARPDVIDTQLPGSNIIVPEKNRDTFSVSGESVVKEGDEIKISCSASGPKQVILKWYFNNIPASQIYGAQHRGKSTVSTIGYHKTVEMIIPQAQRNNTGTYSCHSSNGDIERIVITVKSSEVTSAPDSSDSNESKVSLHGDSTADVGATISLTCRARGPQRPSGVEWYFNGRDIIPEAGVSSINTYPDPLTRNAIISELNIINVQFRNEGTYFCKSKPYGAINKMKVSVQQGSVRPGPVLTEVGSSSTDKEVVCRLPAATGNCKAALTRWYYDHSEGQCKEFTYGGCGGNNNNFVTLNLCNNFCSAEEICLKPKVVGRCRASIPRFYFDNEAGRCKEFIYGGCNENLNNFESHTACDRRCAPYRRQIIATDVKITGTKAPAEQDICKLPQSKGQCSDLHVRWYFVDSLNRCIRFWYTGCGGNDNRFVTEMECLDRCKHTVRPAPTIPTPPSIAPVADKSACAQPKNPGNCDKWVVTWYYDMSRRNCHRFYYGGCGGNSNRFPDRESCENLCISETTFTPEKTTERPSQCVYTTFGCCDDGITTALDRLKSNCYESNVVQPGRDHTMVLVHPLGDAVLTCRLRGSEVVWYRNSFLLSSNRKTEIHTNGSLILRRVTDDMAGTYSCRVLDRNNVPRLERFQVQISVPLDILPGPALMSFKPGHRAYLNCHTVGYPAPKITWEKNGQSIPNNHHFVIHRNGTLIINNIRAEDAGSYHCLADNGVSTKKTRTILLNIKETIDAHIATHKGYYTEGETIQLSCTGNGFPAPSVEWVKDDRTLVTENNVQVDAGNLSVKSASVEDSGTYKCIAKNNKNKAEAITTVQIKLHGPMIQCLDKLSRTRCMSIVRAHLCGIRYFYSSCCQSCEKVSRRPK